MAGLNIQQSFIHPPSPLPPPPPQPINPTQAVPTRTLLAKAVKSFLAQTYSDEVQPVDMFQTSALEYEVDGEDPREVS